MAEIIIISRTQFSDLLAAIATASGLINLNRNSPEQFLSRRQHLINELGTTNSVTRSKID